MRVFFDTNVLVSAFATRGLCADTLRLVLAEHELVTGEVIIEELRRTLSRRFRVPKRTLDEVEQFLRAHKVVAIPDELPDCPVPDRSDLVVLASAIAADADVLVTGDKDLLDVASEIPMRVVDPRGFWDLLRKRKRGKK